jgi:hypothetical protein
MTKYYLQGLLPIYQYHHGQERTIRRFTLNQKGDITKTSTIEKLFINTTRRRLEFEPREPTDRQRNLNLDSGGRLIEPRGAP